MFMFAKALYALIVRNKDPENHSYNGRKLKDRPAFNKTNISRTDFHYQHH